MPPNIRPLLRVARLQSALPRSTRAQRAFASSGSGSLPGGTPGEASEQAVPLGPYYEAILIKPQPIPETKPEEPPTSSPKSPRTTKKAPTQKTKQSGERDDGAPSPPAKSASSSGTATGTPQPSAQPATAQEKARIIFGSRLAGPAERADRLQAIRDRSTLIAGVRVPPRPEEPDNCCMSGCVDCVWDRYRDEMEEWATASSRAERALQAERAQGPVDVLGGVSATKGMSMPPASTSVSMDDDGGGSEANWPTGEMKKADHPKIAKDLWDDDLYKNVPVGIREFMKHEKMLKEKHKRESSSGA